MKVKDYEVLEGIMEEHTNAKVSRISEGLYNVHLELEEERGRICMHRKNCMRSILQ